MSKIINLRLPGQQKAETYLQGLGKKLRNVRTSTGTGTYQDPTIGETADRIKRVVKRVVGAKTKKSKKL